MSITIAQSATASTGGTKAASAVVTLASTPVTTNYCAACVSFDLSPGGSGNIGFQVGVFTVAGTVNGSNQYESNGTVTGLVTAYSLDNTQTVVRTFTATITANSTTPGSLASVIASAIDNNYITTSVVNNGANATITVFMGNLTSPTNFGALSATIETVTGGATLVYAQSTPVRFFSQENVALLFQEIPSSAPKSLTFTFSAITYNAAYYAEFSGAVAARTSFVEQNGSTITTSLDNNPLNEGYTGDLPVAFIAVRDAAATTIPSGWTGLAQLNSAVGKFAYMRIADTTALAANGSVSFHTTVSQLSGGGTDFNAVVLLLVASSVVTQGGISQVPVSVLGPGTANLRVSQENVAVLGYDTGHGRISQVFLNLLIQIPPRISQVPVSVLGIGKGNARVSQVVVSVLWSSKGARRRTTDDEWFIY